MTTQPDMAYVEYDNEKTTHSEDAPLSPRDSGFSEADLTASDSEEESKELLDSKTVHFQDADLEKQLPSRTTSTHHRRTSSAHGAEYAVSTKKKLLYLSAYFALNLSLTVYNKAVLGAFHYPWLLTAVHSTCLSLGCAALYLCGVFKTTKLSFQENLILAAFSVLFTANIGVSNASLALVSVPFHQIIRSTCPAFTVVLYRVFYSRTYANATYLSLLPIIIGAGFATYGDYYATLVGLLVTLLGTLLAAVKTITTNRLMVENLQLAPLELLLRMSPFAAVQSLICAAVAGEGQAFLSQMTTPDSVGHLSRSSLLMAVLGNGFLAFLLNVSSFKTNKIAGALTMTVAANTKQVLTILLGVVVFNVVVTPMNGLGMLITLSGVAYYSMVELDSKNKSKG